VGTVLDETWVAATLRLGGEQDYTVSPFAPSRFYADGPTYVYAAAIHNPQARQAAALGGIAIVWDAHAQMQSILQDCSEGMGTQDLLAFVDPSGQLLHTSPNSMQRPSNAPLQEAMSGQPVIDMQGQLYGVGDAPGRGYREFGTVDRYTHGLRCQALRHLCPRSGKDNADLPVVRQAPRIPAEHHLQMGTFGIAGHWLGLDVRYILNAAADTAVMSAGSARPPMLGFAQIEGKVYQVLDLHGVIGAHGTPPSREPDPTRQMLVLQIPMEDGRQREFALRVDALGGMIDIDTRTLQALRTTTDPNAVSLIDAVVSVTTSTPLQADKQTLLCRIALAWLQQCSTGELAPQDLSLDPAVQRLFA
jgi:chemotaxis signal transduction protein